MLILKRASKSRPGGPWSDDNYDLFDGEQHVGRIMWTHAARDTPWFWTITARMPQYPHDRGYAASREQAWRIIALHCLSLDGIRPEADRCLCSKVVGLSSTARNKGGYHDCQEYFGWQRRQRRHDQPDRRCYRGSETDG